MIRNALTYFAIFAACLVLIEVGLRLIGRNAAVLKRLDCSTQDLVGEYSSVHLIELSSVDGWRLYAENAQGFRDNISTGNRSILILGDSQTYGVNVNQNENYADVLDHSLPSLEVTNAAAPAMGTVDQAIQYGNLAASRNYAAVVLSFFGANDLRNNIRMPPFTEAWRASAELHGRKVSYKPAVLDRKPEPGRFERISNSIYTYVFARSIIRALRHRFWSDSQLDDNRQDMMIDAIALTVAVMDDLQTKVTSRNARFVILSIPSRTEALGGAYTAATRSVLKRLATQPQKFFVLDMLPVFRKHPAPATLFGKGDAHVSAKGHRLIAASLVPVLRDAGLVQAQEGRELAPTASIDPRLDEACRAHRDEFLMAVQGLSG